MIRPGPISAEQLRHPKTPDRSAFQGDERRSDDRQGFVKAKRIRCVEGTRKPANLRPVPTAHLLPDGSVSHGKDISGGVDLFQRTTPLRPIQGPLRGNQGCYIARTSNDGFCH